MFISIGDIQHQCVEDAVIVYFCIACFIIKGNGLYPINIQCDNCDIAYVKMLKY